MPPADGWLSAVGYKPFARPALGYPRASPITVPCYHTVEVDTLLFNTSLSGYL